MMVHVLEMLGGLPPDRDLFLNREGHFLYER